MGIIRQLYKLQSNNPTNNACLDYFRNLNTIKAKRQNGVILYENDTLKQETFDRDGLIDTFSLGNTRVYGKKFTETSLSTIATSKMLNNLLHPTPPMIIIEDAGNYLRTATEDILPLTLQGYEIVRPYEDPNIINLINSILPKINSIYNKYGKWTPLYDKDLKERFLEFMTPECFDELVNHFLAAELRTDSDRHQGNYFLVKKKGSPKYESIIQIDLDRNEILMSSFIHKKTFKNFIENRSYLSVDFFQFFDSELTYRERMKLLQKLVHDSNITTKQIIELKEILEYDLLKEISRTAKHYKGNPEIEKYATKTYDTMSRLWEYNLKTLGREIDL